MIMWWNGLEATYLFLLNLHFHHISNTAVLFSSTALLEHGLLPWLGDARHRCLSRAEELLLINTIQRVLLLYLPAYIACHCQKQNLDDMNFKESERGFLLSAGVNSLAVSWFVRRTNSSEAAHRSGLIKWRGCSCPLLFIKTEPDLPVRHLISHAGQALCAGGNARHILAGIVCVLAALSGLGVGFFSCAWWRYYGKVSVQKETCCEVCWGRLLSKSRQVLLALGACMAAWKIQLQAGWEERMVWVISRTFERPWACCWVKEVTFETV